MSIQAELENLGDEKVFLFVHRYTENPEDDTEYATIYDDYYENILVPKRETELDIDKMTRREKAAFKARNPNSVIARTQHLSYKEVKEFIRYIIQLFDEGKVYVYNFPFIFSIPTPRFKEDFEIPYKVITLTYSMIRKKYGFSKVEETIEICETSTTDFE